MSFLYPLSLIYSFLNFLKQKITKSKKLDKPVISVGNLTWGGSGKTPIVIELLKFLLKNNFNPIVLTRGHGRKSKNPLMLQNGAEGIKSSESGDEPLLIAKSVPAAKIIVGAKRYENALLFKNEAKADSFILDDGFQHWKIKRDLDIVCINAANPFGNGFLIPTGILREKPKSLKRADIIIITNCDMVSDEKLEELQNYIFKICGKKTYLTFYGNPKYKKINLVEYFDISILKKSKNACLSAIGFPEGFKNSVQKSGITIEENIVLKDHKNYSKGFLSKLLEQKKYDHFIITSKDAVKFENINSKMKEKFVVLAVEIQFKNGRHLWEKEILNILQRF